MFNLVDIDDHLVDPDVYIAEWEGKPRCLPAALVLAAAGWNVFPVPPGLKKSHKSARYSGGRLWGMTRDADEIRRNWRQWPGANLAVPTGAVNGIFVVEADTIAGHGVDGIAALRELEAENSALPDTLMSESPTGSIHRYFKHPGGYIKNSDGTLAVGVDVRGDGGMVIAPPSMKPGGSYRWLSQREIADAPAWLIALVMADPSVERQPGEEPEADHELVAAALAVIPNEDVNWEEWNRIGMAAWRATGGSDEGLDAFDAWSQKSGKYNENKTKAKWNAYFSSPPDSIGAGTIFWLANEAEPGWSDKYNAAVEADMAAAADDPQVHAMMLAELGETSRQEFRVEDESSSETPTPPPSKPSKPAEAKVVPVDLWANFEPPPLPTRLLPPTIEEYAFEKGRLMGTDPAGLAAAALAVCAAALPDHVKLKVKRHDNWMEAARLWVALVGDPSSRKTPIITQSTRPIARINAEMWRAYSAAKAHWDALTREERRTAAQPKLTCLCIEDTTVEAAQEVLRDSPNGVLCVRDELAGWFGAMDKYAGHRGAMTDRGFWLQAYNGNSYAYNRIGRGSGVIENLSVSILGGIQEEVIRKIANDTVDDGLIQRIIPVMVRMATMGVDAPTSDAETRYEKLVERLHRREKPFDDLIFDDDAIRIRERMEQKHIDLMVCRTINRKLAAHIGKYDGIFARMCLLWHAIEKSTDRELPVAIGVDTAQRVADFLHRFLLPHAMAFYTTVFGLSDDNEILTDVAGFILAHKIEVVTNRVIQRGTRSMRNLDKRSIDSIMHQLNALGWVNQVPGRRLDSVPWKVNPEVHRLFEERARQEAERRRHDQEMIIALTVSDAGQM